MRTVLHRVVEQVEHHLPQRTAVGQRVHVGRVCRFDADVGGAGERNPILDDRGDRVTQVDRLRAQARHLPLGAREVENVLDQMHQPPSLLHDHARRGPPLLFASARGPG